ncbi:hypothetical protein JXR93_11260 [bacterium]|nr:hypothetical protein [bacterium]
MNNIGKIIDSVFIRLVWTIFWLVIVTHFFGNPKIFFLFVDFHNSYVRDYWALLEFIDGEYGVWPNLLKFMGRDLVLIFVYLGIILIPLNIFKKSPEKKVITVIKEYLTTSIITLLVVFLVGSALISIFIAFIMFFALFVFNSPISKEFDAIFEIFASGIFTTSVFFFAYSFSKNRDSSEKKSIFLNKHIHSIVLAILIHVILVKQIEISVNIDILKTEDKLHIYSYELYKDKINVGDSNLNVYKISEHFIDQISFNNSSLYTTFRDDWRYISIYQKNSPFISTFYGFFQSRPDKISFDSSKKIVNVDYKIKKTNTKPDYIYPITSKPTYKTVDFSDNIDVLSKKSDKFYTIDITDSLKSESFWKLVLAKKDSDETLLFTFEKNSLKIKKTVNENINNIDKNSSNIYSQNFEKNIENVLIKDESLGGFTIFINDTPLFYVEFDYFKVNLISSDEKLLNNFSITIGESEKI